MDFNDCVHVYLSKGHDPDAETARLRKCMDFNDCVLVLQSEGAGTDAIVTKVGY